MSASNYLENAYANVEQRGTDVTRFTLMPWMTRIENAITKSLPRPQYAKFDADAFLRADLKTRYDHDLEIDFK